MTNYFGGVLALICLEGLIFSSTEHGLTVASNVPCMPRSGDPEQGKICVCNSTYCDTIERPSRLVKGQYYRFTTSNSTPGFTQTIGAFAEDAVYDNEDVIYTLNSSEQFQTILGFGGSFTDATGIVLTSLPPAAQDKLIKSYFGPNGLEYTLGRVPMGGSDFSDRLYTLDDYPGDMDLKNFSLSQEDFIYKIATIKRALNASARPVKLYACAWDSPTWMKTNDYYQSGFVQFKYFDAWAKYHVKFLEAFKENGINIWAFSESNEGFLPFFLSGFNGKMFGLLHSAAGQRYWIKYYLIPALKSSNVPDIKLIAMDDIRLFAQFWMERLSADPDVYDLVEGVGMHWYADWYSSPTMLDKLHQSFPDKLLLYTEISINYMIFGGNPVELGSWTRAEFYMYNIVENLNHMANGYFDWNLALDTDGGPGLQLQIDAPVIVNKTSGEFYKQPMFYAMGHFSKFIPPGAVRIGVTSNQNESSILDTSYKQELFQRFMKYELRDVSSDGAPSGLLPNAVVPQVVRCLATHNPDNSYSVVVINTMNVTTRVRVEDPQIGSVTLDLEENSINTFVYWVE